MKKIFTLILCLMMTVSLIGCSNKKNEAVATVNGETITLGNYEKLLALNKLSMESYYGSDIWSKEVEDGKTYKDTLKDMLKILGNREISVNRELTKKYQEVIREDIETVINIFNEKEVKGEFVLIVDGFKGEKTLVNDHSNLNEREYVEVLLSEGMSKKDAIKVVCKERKLKKDFVYKQVLDL